MSVSHLQVEVGGDRIDFELTLQTLTLVEVTALGLDLDGDEELSEGEVAAGWQALTGYLADGLQLELDGEGTPLLFQDWRFGGGGSELVGEASDSFKWMTMSGSLEGQAPPRRILAASELFFEHGNPDHRMFVAVRGLAGAELYGMISAPARTCDFQSEAFGGYLRFGFQHVLEGVDHLAFVLALLFGVGRLGSLLAAVTAFTLAHTLTLTLSALQLLRLPPAVVEPGIAFSVVLVLWLHLAQGTGRARPWIPAFAFGLLHGFGFAGVLGEIGLPPHAQVPALLGFNLGVEVGQLAFVLPVVAAGSGLALLRAELLPAVRRYGGVLLGAFGFVLCGEVVAERWLDPASVWAAPAAELVLAGLLAAGLRRRQAPDGSPLLPLLGTALLLALSYGAGRALAGV